MAAVKVHREKLNRATLLCQPLVDRVSLVQTYLTWSFIELEILKHQVLVIIILVTKLSKIDKRVQMLPLETQLDFKSLIQLCDISQFYPVHSLMMRKKYKLKNQRWGQLEEQKDFLTMLILQKHQELAHTI